MKYVQLIDVSKTYSFRNTLLTAIDNVNFEIARGEFIGVMGESGSGKSTLLNILGGLTSINHGRYVFEGKELVKKCDIDKFRLRNVGFIVQHYALIEDRNVYENVALPLKYRGNQKDEIRRITMNKLEELNISELSERYPYQLSGGQRQKVAIARAIIHNPDILLADEPTGALDKNSEDEVMRMIHTLHASGKTIVLVTHDRCIAKQCERICYLKNGRIDKCE